jgi:hypothetical protein
LKLNPIEGYHHFSYGEIHMNNKAAESISSKTHGWTMEWTMMMRDIDHITVQEILNDSIVLMICNIELNADRIQIAWMFVRHFNTLRCVSSPLKEQLRWRFERRDSSYFEWLEMRKDVGKQWKLKLIESSLLMIGNVMPFEKQNHTLGITHGDMINYRIARAISNPRLILSFLLVSFPCTLITSNYVRGEEASICTLPFVANKSIRTNHRIPFDKMNVWFVANKRWVEKDESSKSSLPNTSLGYY